MSTATGRATTPALAHDYQREDHTQVRATDYRSLSRKTTHTQFGDGLHHVDGDWSPHQTSARTRPPTRRPRTAQSDGLPDGGQEDHTHTDRRRITSCRRRLVAPPDQRPHPTTNHQTTHSLERRITRAWTCTSTRPPTRGPHTQFGDGPHDVDDEWSRHPPAPDDLQQITIFGTLCINAVHRSRVVQ